MATKKATSTKKATPSKTASAKTSTKTVVKAQKATGTASIQEHVISSMRSPSLWRALGAEFLGTALLAGIVIAGQGQPIFVLFGIVGLVIMFGAISGAHFNPAITIGAWITKRIGWLRSLAYILAQVLGAMAMFFAMQGFVGGAPAVTEEAVSYGYTKTEVFSATALSTLTNAEWYILFAEVLGTAVLGYAVAYALRSKETLTAAFSVGAGLFTGLMIGITATGYAGGSSILNPAVAISLQAFDSSVWSYAVYALGPIIGAVIGFGLFDLLKKKA